MAIYAPPDTAIEVVLTGAPTGLSPGIRVIDTPTGSTVLARTTAGIAEEPSGSGIYSTEIDSPSELGQYAVVWDDGTTFSAEELFVRDIDEPFYGNAIYADPGGEFQAMVVGAPTGLTGTIGVQLVDEGTVLIPRTTEVAEHPTGSGIYFATLTAPETPGEYTLIWDTGGALTPDNTAAEALFVEFSRPTDAQPVYASVNDLRQYMAVNNTDLPDDEASRLLRASERDIDAFVGPREINETTGLKFAPTDLDTQVAAQLTRATCAQGEYRFTMGDEFFIRPRFSQVSGPDFSRTGTPPILGPKAQQEIMASGLCRLTARATPGARRRPRERRFDEIWP